MVYLINRTTQGISLKGWSLLNKNDEPYVLSGDIWLSASAVQAVTMGGVSLSNKGGLITLLDQNRLKVDGVSYTQAQADAEGELVIFR